MTETNHLVIYHSGCPDGFAAAWSAWRFFGDEGARYEPWQYGEAPPYVDENTDLFILDFSFKRKEMEALIASAKRVLCLDHHKTAQKELEGLPGCVFDMDRSGAAMAWDYFCRRGKEPRPWLIDYVQDRDLWRWELPKSKAVSAWVMTQPHKFPAWNDLCDAGVEKAIELGSAIRLHITHYCEHMDRQARWANVGGIVMPALNAPMFNVSDLLHRICDIESRTNNCPAAACAYWIRGDGQVQHSLRSIGDIDVSEIARSFGGGGHKNAAGFQAGHFVGEWCSENKVTQGRAVE